MPLPEGFTPRWTAWQDMDQATMYLVMKERVEVFVVEQECPYQELDGQDELAEHLLIYQQEKLAAYLRLLPPGTRFEQPSIGRVLTVAEYRGRGLGRPLMIEGIKRCEEHYPGIGIMVSAQAHLQPFYNSLGFEPQGLLYDEDGIFHIDMMRAAS